MRKLIYISLFFFAFGGVSGVKADTQKKSFVLANPTIKNKLSPPKWEFHMYDLEKKSFSRPSYASADSMDIFQMPGEFEEKKEGMKSVTKAALFSFLLPGAGEIYGGSKTKGKIFLLSETSAWVGFFSFRAYGSWLEDDYRSYAASNAQVNLKGKSDDFFDQLAFYDSRDQYNQLGLLYHRGEASPYPENDFWNWEWDSKESRLHYRDLKNRSKDASRKAIYMVGLSIVNRILSVVDAMKTVRSYNRKKSFEFSGIKLDLKAQPLGHNPHFMLYVSRTW